MNEQASLKKDLSYDCECESHPRKTGSAKATEGRVDGIPGGSPTLAESRAAVNYPPSSLLRNSPPIGDGG